MLPSVAGVAGAADVTRVIPSTFRNRDDVIDMEHAFPGELQDSPAIGATAFLAGEFRFHVLIGVPRPSSCKTFLASRDIQVNPVSIVGRPLARSSSCRWPVLRSVSQTPEAVRFSQFRILSTSGAPPRIDLVTVGRQSFTGLGVSCFPIRSVPVIACLPVAYTAPCRKGAVARLWQEEFKRCRFLLPAFGASFQL
jgi:hypothetical protein